MQIVLLAINVLFENSHANGFRIWRLGLIFCYFYSLHPKDNDAAAKLNIIWILFESNLIHSITAHLHADI